ncbi:uncharacterized protein LOC124439103 [Xenia sp. Carnegie-2017]|uniref:uncharacterized protein LOC124439103 n=1 Tax=Xenia sp. Carnegie-2017 TaxID=2897299 RepID=UPI001F0501AC|nr:uncharacterized protein LOC124439103 [Xenia sp. Carnegie-2017]
MLKRKMMWIFVCALIFNHMWFIEGVAEGSLSKINNVRCDPNHVCPDGNTCCKDDIKKIYGCCPLKDGVCCLKKYTCCPKGTMCDGYACKKSPAVYAAMLMEPSMKQRAKSFLSGNETIADLILNEEQGIHNMKISINFPAMFLNILNHHSRRTRKERTIVNTEHYIWFYFKTSNVNVASNSEYITPLAFTQRAFPWGHFLKVFSRESFRGAVFLRFFPGFFTCGSFSDIFLQGLNPSFCPEYCTCSTVSYSMLYILNKLVVTFETYISSR